MVVRSALLPFWNRVLPESRNRELYTWRPGAKNSWPFQIDVSDRVITKFCCSGVSYLLFGCIFLPQYASMLAFSALGFGFGRRPLVSLAAFAFAAGVREPHRIERTEDIPQGPKTRKIRRQQHEDNSEKSTTRKSLKNKQKSTSIGPA